VFQSLADSFAGILLVIIVGLIPYGFVLYGPFILLNGINPWIYARNVFLTFTVPLILFTLLFGSASWLAATWYRRSALLSDRIVAKSFGRNALIQALTKCLLIERTFQRQWLGIANDAVWRLEDKANLYKQFKTIWESFPDAYKEKSVREVSTGFPAFLYFLPTIHDRAELLKDIPNQLTDNRPAETLLPGITEIGADMAQDMFGWNKSKR
jgi:hypothetical protein